MTPITPQDFLFVSLGISSVLISFGVMMRLIGNKPANQLASHHDPADVGLNNRLREFQEARFSSPIFRRNQDVDVPFQDAGPGSPRPQLAPRVPPRRVKNENPNKIVQLPVKKDEPTKKD